MSDSTTTPLGATTTIAARQHSLQAPATVLMIRPHHFSVNPQTAADNVFQSSAGGRDDADIAASFQQAAVDCLLDRLGA